jgi:N-acetylglutamate synthase-like GNAT family acetyltransferase
MPTYDLARPDDVDAIAALIVGIQREEFGLAITRADQPDIDDIDGFYREGRGDFWVARHGTQVIGTIALKDIGQGAGALRKMFVHRDWRGTNPSVAAALLQALHDAARKRGFDQIYLGTTDRFLAAHRFYEKHGFTVVAAETLPEAFPRMAVDTRFYCRKILRPNES